ncbi:CbtA family protein [Ancylobacter sp. IITR112]|uniref:CbtA family protein n=1 Tax=Ancylobacter sp. IITR112 TaxID=3138073 RepID=UPI003529F7D8
MAGKLLFKGMLAGLVAGLVIFVFLHAFGESQIEHAIAFEERMEAAQALPQGGHAMATEPELVSRQIQAGIGLLTGVLVYGAGVGGLFAIAFAFANGRLGPLSPRSTAILLACVGLIAAILVPALKYPPNPPAVGSGDTINARTQLYFVMMAFSLITAVASLITARRLWASLGGWRASLLAAGAYVVAIALAMAALPSINEIPEAFPIDTLHNFRLASLAAHVIFWTVLAAAFAAIHTKQKPAAPHSQAVQ